jgi:hypothetical protein
MSSLGGVSGACCLCPADALVEAGIAWVFCALGSSGSAIYISPKVSPVILRGASTAARGWADTNRSGYLNRYPRHADVGAVEVLDGLRRIFWSLVADIAYAALGDEFDVGDFSAFAREVLAKVGFGDVGRQVSHKESR